MFNADTELLFPPRVIAGLRSLRGPAWRTLCQAAGEAGEGSAGQTAFVLMMARLCGCASCNVDTFRALHGCSQCARQSLQRFRGEDRDLAEMYRATRKEVEQHLKENS